MAGAADALGTAGQGQLAVGAVSAEEEAAKAAVVPPPEESEIDAAQATRVGRDVGHPPRRLHRYQLHSVTTKLELSWLVGCGLAA